MKVLLKYQTNLFDEIIVDGPAGGGAVVRANMPEWCGKRISTMEDLEKAVAV